MIEIILAAIIIFAIGFGLSSKNMFRSEGQTQGVCIEVKVETDVQDGSPYNEQMRGMDTRMYRPYIEYSWKGNKYVAKSYRAYSGAKYFPGDSVTVLVSRNNKEIVKIINKKK